MAAFNSATPAPVAADVGTSGASARKLSATNSRTSMDTTSRVVSSTRSHLVSAMTPVVRPRRRRISRCSRVWGMTESSAATTSRARSIPVAPASIFLMNRSCPGTSTTPRRNSPRSSEANPMSMVIPRAFSSGRRSVSTPVRALTSEVLPWSMWPAVPRIRSLGMSGSSSGGIVPAGGAGSDGPAAGSVGPAEEPDEAAEQGAGHRPDGRADHPLVQARGPVDSPARRGLVGGRFTRPEFLVRVELERVGELLEHRQRGLELVLAVVAVQQDHALAADHPERNAVHLAAARDVHAQPHDHTVFLPVHDDVADLQRPQFGRQSGLQLLFGCRDGTL